jgi:hypothetical protein
MLPCLFVHLTTTVGPLVGCKIFFISEDRRLQSSSSAAAVACSPAIIAEYFQPKSFQKGGSILLLFHLIQHS